MKKPDDCSLTPEQYANVVKRAEFSLREASAFDKFPTPVDDIMGAAKVTLAPHDLLDETFLKKMRAGAEKILRSALEKVLGLFDAKQRLIFIDRSVIAVKQTFLKLHETGHAALPHQNTVFSLFEDSKKTLEPETSELFDREANVFASEVLFQLEKFETEAADLAFGIKTPMSLSKKYGSSVYAAVRRYVQKSQKTCAVLVLNQPELKDMDGFTITLRRFIASETFTFKFGHNCFSETFTANDEIGALVPLEKAMSRPREIVLIDQNGDRHECIAEAFNNTYQVFILIHVKKSLSEKKIFIMNEYAIE